MTGRDYGTIEEYALFVGRQLQPGIHRRVVERVVRDEVARGRIVIKGGRVVGRSVSTELGAALDSLVTPEGVGTDEEPEVAGQRRVEGEGYPGGRKKREALDGTNEGSATHEIFNAREVK